MTKGQVEYASRKAYENFDKWNDVTGFVPISTSHYHEILGCIENAVHIGIQMALNGNIEYNEDGTVKYTK